MNREDVIRMAREAGLHRQQHNLMSNPVQYRYSYDGYEENLEAFAALVAAAEREAIAQMVEDAPPLAEFVKNDKGGCMVCGFTPKLAAAAIRARGQG
jgi:hypothetical protein